MEPDEIFLLGYDCGNREGHHYSDRAVAMRSNMLRWLKGVKLWQDRQANPPRIYNANPKSKIREFPFKDPLDREARIGYNEPTSSV